MSFSEPNYPLTSFCLALLFDELTVFRSSRHIALENGSIEGKANRENLYAFILGSLRPRPTVDGPNYAKVIGTPHQQANRQCSCPTTPRNQKNRQVVSCTTSIAWWSCVPPVFPVTLSGILCSKSALPHVYGNSLSVGGIHKKVELPTGESSFPIALCAQWRWSHRGVVVEPLWWSLVCHSGALRAPVV